MGEELRLPPVAPPPNVEAGAQPSLRVERWGTLEALRPPDGGFLHTESISPPIPPSRSRLAPVLSLHDESVAPPLWRLPKGQEPFSLVSDGELAR